MTMRHYALMNHVFVCLQDEHVVFLDVHEDRYFALEAAKTRALGALVPGWPVRPEESYADAERLSGLAVIELLVQKGLLTGDSVSGKDATPIECEAPVDELVAESCDEAPDVRFTDLCRFLIAAASAGAALRFCTFEGVVRRERNHRKRQWRRPGTLRLSTHPPKRLRERSSGSSGTPQEHPPEIRRTHELISIFASLRPYFFTAKDACLFETLALGKFLASYGGVQVRWIFGIQARPFAAHCWLQQGDIVLNDTVDHVARYTPIMIV